VISTPARPGADRIASASPPPFASWAQPDNQYEALRARASRLEIAGHTVYYASLNDIMVSKEVAGRPKDLEALPELHAIRDARR